LNLSFEEYRDLWQNGLSSGEATPLGYPGSPEAGIAIVGDFAGIQSFVLRPVPGAGGAAKRLRSRSFRVSAYTELLARWCRSQLSAAQPRILYSAGGLFLIGAGAISGWRELLRNMQKQVDDWAWESFQGELVFHLAGAEFSSAKIPRAELEAALEARRNRPLAETLLNDAEWNSSLFFHPALPAEARCEACGMTQGVTRNSGGEDICDACSADEERGFGLANAAFARISNYGAGDLTALGTSMHLHQERKGYEDDPWLSFGESAPGAEPWYLLRHLPRDSNGNPLDFEQIADHAAGSRKWLGYPRIDVDHAGHSFRRLEGDPLRTWALSHLLNNFFAKEANDLLDKPENQNIYAVYGGGDDLFVIGPWNDVLDYAETLRSMLTDVVGDALTFSAGVTLAKPREHILSQAEFAHEQLDHAKNQLSYGRDCGRDQISALGAIADWKTFSGLLSKAKQVTDWANDHQIPSSFLQQALQFHHTWKRTRKDPGEKETFNSVRYRPLLYYQIQRNLKPGPAREWAQTLLASSSEWPWVDFIVRYAMLAVERDKKEGG
jgi:CRISPR-associated protein Csm1